jgi:hypothetical protein
MFRNPAINIYSHDIMRLVPRTRTEIPSKSRNAAIAERPTGEWTSTRRRERTLERRPIGGRSVREQDDLDR